MSHNRVLMMWNAIIVAALVVTSALVIWDVLAPKPGFNLTPQAQLGIEQRIRRTTYEQKEQAAAHRATIAARVWTEDAEQIGPAALAVVNGLAAKRSLKVASFRPQKPVEEGTLIRLPYLVSLEGAYPNVVAFVRDLEQAGNRLAVNVVQLASTDGDSSAVKATVGVWALKVAPKAPAASAPTRRRPATPRGSA